MVYFDPFPWSAELKWKAPFIYRLLYISLLTLWDQWPVYSNGNKPPSLYLALSCSPCHVCLAARPNSHLLITLHDRSPKTITNDDDCPVSVFIKWAWSKLTFMYTSPLSSRSTLEGKSMHRQFLCKVLVVRTKSHHDGFLIRTWNYFIHFCVISHFFVFVCFYFFSLFSKCQWNKRADGGELRLSWTLCRWLLSQSIHCDFCFLWTIKNQSKSASFTIKPNSNPDFFGVCLLTAAVVGCLGFHVLTVALKHLTWFHSAFRLCQGINKKWGMTYFLSMGGECVLCMWLCSRLFSCDTGLF